MSSNFSIAYDALNFLYGGDLIQPTWTSATPLVGQMILFNQEAFMNPPPALVQRKVDATVTQWLATYLALYDPADWGWETSGLSNWTIPKTTTPNDEQQSQLTAASFDFDVKGFVYFPLACAKTKKCPIHVAIHGCRQGLWRDKLMSEDLIVFSFFFCR